MSCKVSERWPEFRSAYRMELRAPEARRKIAELAKLAKSRRVTLLYGARDEEHNNAVVLKSVLEKAMGSSASKPRQSRKSA